MSEGEQSACHRCGTTVIDAHNMPSAAAGESVVYCVTSIRRLAASQWTTCTEHISWDRLANTSTAPNYTRRLLTVSQFSTG
jgi:hypothetical protein